MGVAADPDFSWRRAENQNSSFDIRFPRSSTVGSVGVRATRLMMG
jgi:hypothetical protein